MEPPYKLAETDTDVTMEVQLPFWIEADDVRVNVTESSVDVQARRCVTGRRGAARWWWHRLRQQQSL